MDSSVSPKDKIGFLRVCHHISNAVYLHINCNKKYYLLKNILAYCWYSPISPFFFLPSDIKTAITRQLIRKARMLEAEWWQVCREEWVRGQRKMNQVLGAFGMLDFTMLRPVLAWRAFLFLWTVYLIFQMFFGPRPTADTEVHLYS